MNDSRYQFEKWCISNKFPIDRAFGEYVFQRVEDKWEVWQASRAAIEVDLPDMVDFELLDESQVKQSLTSLGLKVKP